MLECWNIGILTHFYTFSLAGYRVLKIAQQITKLMFLMYQTGRVRLELLFIYFLPEELVEA